MATKQKDFLGGLSRAHFLREYWQKKPLLIRNAFPGFTGLLTPQELAGLACLEDAQSRLITQKRERWQLKHGPLQEQDFTKLPKTKWTLLVQGVNHFLPEAERLLQAFNFIPHARLDDLMVSFAPCGGSVGPHFDSYDVFLLQGLGERSWEISAQRDLSLQPNAPLKILQHFLPEQDWLLSPGDMLYLPPHYAHHGVAQNDCMTYSIGFRAPTTQELATQFLIYLQDHLQLEGMYQDPDLKPQKHAGEISANMIKQVAHILKQIRWGKTDIARFLGQYLSEPKSHIFFAPPRSKKLALDEFVRRAYKNGVRLDLKSQLLFHENLFFMNGETSLVGFNTCEILATLADSRRLPPGINWDNDMQRLLYQWYGDGYITLDKLI